MLFRFLFIHFHVQWFFLLQCPNYSKLIILNVVRFSQRVKINYFPFLCCDILFVLPFWPSFFSSLQYIYSSYFKVLICRFEHLQIWIIPWSLLFIVCGVLSPSQRTVATLCRKSGLCQFVSNNAEFSPGRRYLSVTPFWNCRDCLFLVRMDLFQLCQSFIFVRWGPQCEVLAFRCDSQYVLWGVLSGVFTESPQQTDQSPCLPASCSRWDFCSVLCPVAPTLAQTLQGWPCIHAGQQSSKGWRWIPRCPLRHPTLQIPATSAARKLEFCLLDSDRLLRSAWTSAPCTGVQKPPSGRSSVRLGWGQVAVSRIRQYVLGDGYRAPSRMPSCLCSVPRDSQL